jgi:hypothetical protein
MDSFDTFLDDNDDLDIDENINNISNENINNISNENNTWEKIIQILGLNNNINYPIKTIQAGLFEIYLTKINNNLGRYTKNFKFKDDSISKELEKYICGPHPYSPYSQIQIFRHLLRLYRNHKYSNIVNIVDVKNKNNKKDVMGFNYDNPRWNSLDQEYI